MGCVLSNYKSGESNRYLSNAVKIKSNTFSGIDLNEYVLSSSKRFFYLTILNTHRCNFRCRYCYQDFHNEDLSSDILFKIKQLVASQAQQGLKRIHICWFGGEPTLNRKNIINLGCHIKESYDLLSYSSNISTNGYLLSSKLFLDLFRAGVNEYQISLDGDQKTHDLTRVKKNGSGSFNAIWNNLLSIKTLDVDFRIDIRVHITQSNYHSLFSLAHELTREFSRDTRFNVSLELIKNLGGSQAGQYAVKGISQSEIKELEAAFSPMIRKEKQCYSNICYAAMPRHLLVYPDGRLGKCTVMLNDPRNIVGKLGENGEVILDNDRFSPWIRGFDSLNTQALACPAKNLPSLNSPLSNHPQDYIPVKNV